jgi:hypothetical protein
VNVKQCDSKLISGDKVTCCVTETFCIAWCAGVLVGWCAAVAAAAASNWEGKNGSN